MTGDKLTREPMTDDQIKHMVDRFLGWKLPKDFRPDAGISFERRFNVHTGFPMRHKPSGTNLFDATQAEAMVRYTVEGMPSPPPITDEEVAAQVNELQRMSVAIYAGVEESVAEDISMRLRKTADLLEKLSRERAEAHDMGFSVALKDLLITAERWRTAETYSGGDAQQALTHLRRAIDHASMLKTATAIRKDLKSGDSA